MGADTEGGPETTTDVGLLGRSSLLRFQACLLRLAASYDLEFDDFVRHALKADAGIMGVDRVSFWRFVHPPEIRRQVLYSLREDAFEGELVVREDACPHYFAAMRRDMVISTSNARLDPRTRDLEKNYLGPLNITAMLDVPVWANGELAGVICHEQVGSPRVWQPEEEAFAFSVGQIISTAFELDERRRVERELLETDEQLRLFTSNVSDYSLVMLDPVGRVHTGAERIRGWKREDVLGQHFSIFFPEDAVKQGIPERALRQALEEGRFDEPLSQLRPDGTRYEARVLILPIYGRKTGLRGFAKIAHDLTEQTLARENERLLQETRRAEARQRLLSHLSATLGTTLEAERHMEALGQLVEAGFADAVVFHHETVVEGRQVLRPVVVADRLREHQPALQRWAEECAPAADCTPVITQALKARKPRVVQDPMELSNDASRHASFRAIGYTSALIVPTIAHDRTVGFLSAFRRGDDAFAEQDLPFATEVSQRIGYAVDNSRLYRLSREAVDLRDVFLSVAAHELKTPISALRLTLEGIQRLRTRPPPDADILEVFTRRVGLALRQSGRLGRLVDELLEVSRINSGRLSLQVKPVDVGALVTEVASSMADSAANAGSELRVTTADGAMANVDRIRFEQVVTNLLSNAFKFGSGKPVEVEVGRRGADVELRVRDHGIGIEQKDQARIFGRFERAVPVVHFGGMGLGLFIAQEIVTAHHGHIAVESRRGEGSTFTVTLPPMAETAYAPQVVH